MAQSAMPQFCDRCLRMLQPGRIGWYLITIQAIADPDPPAISAEDLAELDPRSEIEQLFRELATASPQELQDQVYRRVMLTLCRPCYEQWIEDPAGRGGPSA